MCHDKISTRRGTSHACHIRLRSSLDHEDLSKETFVDYNIGARFRIQQSSSIEFKTTLGRKQKGRNRNRKVEKRNVGTTINRKQPPPKGFCRWIFIYNVTSCKVSSQRQDICLRRHQLLSN